MKKMLSIILAGMMLLSLAACNSQQGAAGGTNLGATTELVEYDCYEGEGYYISAEFSYPDSDQFILKDGDYTNSKIVVNEEENYEVQVGLYEDSTYWENKEYNQEEDSYKEFKVCKYDAYGYEGFGGYYICIHLENLEEGWDRYIEVGMNRPDYSRDSMEGEEFYKNETIRAIVDSIVFNGALEVSEDAE